jgi:hypothetical protein
MDIAVHLSCKCVELSCFDVWRKRLCGHEATVVDDPRLGWRPFLPECRRTKIRLDFIVVETRNRSTACVSLAISAPPLSTAIGEFAEFALICRAVIVLSGNHTHTTAPIMDGAKMPLSTFINPSTPDLRSGSRLLSAIQIGHKKIADPVGFATRHQAINMDTNKSFQSGKISSSR